jgi:membrane-associated PAP2 superfamily phosphatase
MNRLQSTHPELLWTLAVFGLLLGWDASGLDLVLARPWATAQGFGLRDHWLLSSVLHEGARRAAWLPCLWLLVGIWKPTGWLRQVSDADRVQWAVGTLLALAAISLLKQASHTSCPWDLAEFGGQASWVSHWAWNLADGGPGRCFPAGHASAGFAFLPGYFILRRCDRQRAWIWLAGALVLGLLLGGAQQLRGAHFMSHTAWTGWLCWTVGGLVDWLARPLTPAASQTPSASPPVLRAT